MAQENLKKQKPLEAVKLPDLSKMTDEEIDAYAKEIYGKLSSR